MSTTGASMRERLAAPPSRGLGAANAVAKEAASDPAKLQELVVTLEDDRPVVQARASNALKKVQQLAPRALDSSARRLLHHLATAACLEARWNLATVVAGLALPPRDRAVVLEFFFEALRAESALLRTAALQGLANLAAASGGDPQLKRRVLTVLTRALDDPSAAVRARARKLLRAQ